MKILLDHSAPMNLARHLADHEVKHTTQLGCGEILNGELLKIAEASGSELMITAYKNIPHQQNLAQSNLAQLQLSTNNWPLLQPYIPLVVQAVDQIKPAERRQVFCGQFVPRKAKRPSGPSVP